MGIGNDLDVKEGREKNVIKRATREIGGKRKRERERARIYREEIYRPRIMQTTQQLDCGLLPVT